ncbi:DUF736 domain-containing protein [Mesorhizobium sp. RMAD-H1]|uniref:DUF736 domain-containing protein n=1 Tax=Mesorhizobium sp. RMAD-H1 TaxID=2587065 RepID=UPI001614B94F|nr:DUF736 domain-containing protein [Mesorhizobium sp. RMAD-H1]MBB2972679.1 uncharacterized protein (DUF736 family) [Mesorhizobium sp. RMAD-H1]
MAQIGQFIRTQSGFSGQLKALGIEAEITFVPAEPSDSENAPSYRVLLGDEEGFDIGAGWTHIGDRAGEYVSIEIDSPLFAKPLRANLFNSSSDGSLWGLHMNRPAKPRRED